MKKMALICIIAVVCFLSACASHRVVAKQENTFTIKIVTGSYVKEMSPDEPPALFQFVFESDFVIVASTAKAIPIGKREKKSELDLADWMAGSVNQFQVEEILFSKGNFTSNQPLNTNFIRTFEVFKRLGDLKSTYKENTRYLLFLKEISKDDKVFSELELDKDKNYFRPLSGEQSIFPDSGDSIHGTNNVGKIDLSTGRYSNLVDSIKQYCLALSTGNRAEAIQNLRKLSKSDNKILRENADYTINYLEQ